MPSPDHRTEAVNGVVLHWVEVGEGPLVVLLHGFPEFWYSWRRQIPALVKAGYRVVALDMRGYNRSGKPSEVESYRIRHLTEDVVALIGHLGEKRATVVGHDWGGVVTWNLARHHPYLLDGIVVLNAPPLGAMRRGLRRPRQLLRSWYVFFFQLPWIPELLLRAFDYKAVEWILRRDLRGRELFGDDDLALYKAALSKPGALTAQINYYRAAFRGLFRRGKVKEPRLTVPAMVIWGEDDRYLGSHFADDLARWVAGVRVERISYAGHWVQLDAAKRVNELIVAFLGERRRRRRVSPAAGAGDEAGASPPPPPA